MPTCACLGASSGHEKMVKNQAYRGYIHLCMSYQSATGMSLLFPVTTRPTFKEISPQIARLCRATTGPPAA